MCEEVWVVEGVCFDGVVGVSEGSVVGGRVLDLVLSCGSVVFR